MTIPHLNYQNLAVLNQLKETKEILEQYLVVVSGILKIQYPNYPSTMELDFDNQKYTFKQNGWGFDIETGVWWDLGDLYFGMKIIVPQGTDDDNVMRYSHKWSYGIDGYNESYFQLFRFVDSMIVGNAKLENDEIIEKFKLLCLQSEEVILSVEKIMSRDESIERI
jgi:hypothetical protein